MSITQDTGWSTSVATAAFSTGLVVSAVMGVPVARILQRRGTRPVMTAASAVGVIAIVLIATAPTLPLFFAAWTVAGVAMAGTLYQPAFAAIPGWFGVKRVGAITTVTLVAGLASTIFAPLTDPLLHHFSWRTNYLVLAAILAAVTVPVHLRSGGHHTAAATVVIDRRARRTTRCWPGWFSAPVTVATALAPWVGTVVASTLHSHSTALGIHAALVLGALIAVCCSIGQQALS